MKYKKTGSFLIALLMIIMQFSAFAKQNIPTDVLGTEFESAYVLLNGLSIMEEKDDETFKPYSYITRGEFAKIAVKLLGDRIAEGSNVFEDVSPDSDYCSAVNTLYLYGIIGGNEEHKFNPDNNIRGSEAIKILVNILNYTMLAENKGGYPNGYMSVATEIGLMADAGVAADEYVTNGKAAKLIVNMLDLPLFEMTGMENGYPQYSMDGDKLLYVNLGIEKVRGIVNANAYFAIDGLMTSAKNSIRIGNDSYVVSDNEQKKSVGRLVDCYYKYNNELQENEIKCLVEYEKKNNVTYITSDEYDKITNLEVIYYTDGDNREELKLSTDVCVIYNGQVLDTITDETFDIAMGDMTLIDNDGDDECEVAYVNSYENILVSGITKDYIYSKYDAKKNINLEEGEYSVLTFENTDNRTIELSDIQAGNVLSVFKSANGKILRAVKSDKTISGKIEYADTSGELAAVRINDTEYTVSKDFTGANSVKIVAGLEGNFCFDAYGKIYTVTNNRVGTEQFGYIIKAVHDTSTGEELIKVRLMEEDGRIYVRDCEESVVIDGKKCSTLSQIETALQVASEKPVIFKLNSKEKINYVDTPVTVTNNAQDVLNPIEEGFTGRYKTGTKVFEGRLAINTQTCVMVIPSEPASASAHDFGVADNRYFANDTQYRNLSGYAIGDNLFADILILGDSQMSRDSGNIYIVKDIKQVVNDDEETVHEITVLENGSEVAYKTRDLEVINKLHKITAASGSYDTTSLITDNIVLGEGDAVKFGLDSSGNVSKIKLIYSAENKTLYSVNPNSGDYHLDIYRYVMCDVEDIMDGIVKVKVGTAQQFYNISSASVTVYDGSARKDMRLGAGSYNEIAKGNKCLFISKGGSPVHTVLYK